MLDQTGLDSTSAISYRKGLISRSSPRHADHRPVIVLLAQQPRPVRLASPCPALPCLALPRSASFMDRPPFARQLAAWLSRPVAASVTNLILLLIVLLMALHDPHDVRLELTLEEARPVRLISVWTASVSGSGRWCQLAPQGQTVCETLALANLLAWTTDARPDWTTDADLQRAIEAIRRGSATFLQCFWAGVGVSVSSTCLMPSVLYYSAYRRCLVLPRNVVVGLLSALALLSVSPFALAIACVAPLSPLTVTDAWTLRLSVRGFLGLAVAMMVMQALSLGVLVLRSPRYLVAAGVD